MRNFIDIVTNSPKAPAKDQPNLLAELAKVKPLPLKTTKKKV